MKRVIWIIGIACLLSGMTRANNYQDGSILKIAAPSGLKLRTLPNMHSDVITIMNRGAEVNVIDDFEFKSKYQDRISWMDGHWIYIEYQGVRGYVFDGFLSDLPEVEEDDEFCFPCYDLIYSLENYLDYNFTCAGEIDTVQESDYLLKYISELESGIRIERSQGEGWYGLKVFWEETRLSEIMNLFRNMILDKDDLKEFDRSIIYKEGRDGLINSALINYRGQTIKIGTSSKNQIKIEAVISSC